MKSIFFLVIVFLITACIQKPASNSLGGVVDEEAEYNEVMSNNTNATKPQSKDTTTIEQFTNQLIDILSENNLTEFAQYLHPKKGTYFSPYTFLDTTGVNYKTNQFLTNLNQNKVILWGKYDASGEPIKLTINDYFKQFVYAVNFKTLTTHKSINSKLANSNTINNIKTILPNAEYVEYYYKGSENFEGMDWASLIFYVEKFEGKYYLVAVVHNQWTI